MERQRDTPMLDFLLNHSPVFVGGELLLGLSLGMFGVALANTVRERYAVWVPLKKSEREPARVQIDLPRQRAWPAE
jgi:hypothetical protein